MKRGKFNKKEKRSFIFHFALIWVIISLLLLFKPDYILLILFILLFPYLYFGKGEYLRLYIIATIISAIWAFLARGMYSYNQEFLSFFGINIIPFLIFTFGIFVAYLSYAQLNRMLNWKSFRTKLILYSLIYWAMLIATETISYHLLGIHNVATEIYSGLPFCDCMHSPNWMQAAYFLLGPISFTIHYLLRFHKKS